jgi:tetratricopeptide (TPR) repeat protein/TolB-like protein/predicted Ser/Thr protein kinase
VNIGDTISRYRILGPLGKGGMGIVYHATDTRLNRSVALKFLPQDTFTEQDKQRFLNEARAAAQARHPNICPVYDIEEAEGQVFIAMAYLEGETLLRKVSRGALESRRAIDFAIQIASGLESAHELGIVHRDIKSSNIMVSPAGHISIMDFGLALQTGATRLTVEGGTLGTPAYMSPEQAQGHAVDRRTDLWSLGVVLFEMLTGTLPFRREHASATIHAILFDKTPLLSLQYAGVPPELQLIVERALEKLPEKRWQTAQALLTELKRIPDSMSLQTETIRPVVQPVKRGRVRIAAVGTVLAIGCTAAGLGVYRYAGRAPAAIAAPARVPAVPVALPEKLPENKQIAVLPFEVTGPAGTTRAVADGMVEILTAALSDFERFHGTITAVPSSEIRRRAINTPAEAHRVYGVNLVLTGSAQPAADKVQFTLNLVDAATLRQIGSQSFVYDSRDPVVAKDQAVAAAVRLLNFDLTPSQRTVMSAGDTATPGAYSAYLEGRGLLARYDVAGNIDKAIASFRSAAQQDPAYALALSGLAEAYWRKALSTGDKEWSLLATGNAERAVQVDGGLAIAHAVLGEVYGSAGREEDAIRELQRAMELAPNNAEAPRQLAKVYTNLGRFEEAEALYVKAAKARPTDWYGHLLLGLFYLQRERYAEAEAALKNARVLTPDNDLIYRNLAGIYVPQGRYREAIEELQKGLKIKSNALTYQMLGGAYFLEHRYRDATNAAETAIDLDSGRYNAWGNLGIYYKWTPGNEAKAAPALLKAVELARKFLDTTPKDYNVRANVAEYEARLGNAKASLEEIDRIPPTARKPLTSKLAIAYELTGHRKKAIELIRSNLTSATSLNLIRDDPDLINLWNDSAFQKAVRNFTR